MSNVRAAMMWLLWSMRVPTSLSEKDSNYLPFGLSNPNVNDTMYWRDSLDILRDLDQFDKLYIRYHNCAISPFSSVATNHETLENKAYWYMGLTQPYRANVAFSLYGVLKGQRDQGCKKSTFINSFFTRQGVQTFVQALKLMNYLGGINQDSDGSDDVFARFGGEDEYAHPGFSSVCLRFSGDDGDDGENNNKNGYASQNNHASQHEHADQPIIGYDEDAKAYSTEIGETLYPKATSFTLGCTSEGQFQIEYFKGGACNPEAALGSYDSLKEINERLEALECALLYENLGNVTDNIYSWIDENERATDRVGADYYYYDYADEFIPSISSPLDLLKNSESCSTILDWSMCPDPFGKVALYFDRLNRGTRVVVHNDSSRSRMIRVFVPIILGLCGVLMLVVASHLESVTRSTAETVPVVAKPFYRQQTNKSEDNCDTDSGYSYNREHTDETGSVDTGVACLDGNAEENHQRKTKQPKNQEEKTMLQLALTMLKKGKLRKSRNGRTMPVRMPAEQEKNSYVSPEINRRKGIKQDDHKVVAQTKREGQRSRRQRPQNFPVQVARNSRQVQRSRGHHLPPRFPDLVADSSLYEMERGDCRCLPTDTTVPKAGSAHTVTRSASKSVKLINDIGMRQDIPIMALVASRVESEVTIHKTDFPKKKKQEDFLAPSALDRDDSVYKLLFSPPRVTLKQANVSAPKETVPTVSVAESKDPLYAGLRSPPQISHKNPQTKRAGEAEATKQKPHCRSQN